MKQIIRFFTPNLPWTSRAMGMAVVGWIGILCAFWFTRSAVVPRPHEIIMAFPKLFGRGLLEHMFTSLVLNAQALTLTMAISLTLSYLTVLPWMRPVAWAVTKLRFLGLTGLTFFFTLATSSGHMLKLAILTFGMTVYFVTAMTDVVSSIPKEKFDYARTLRMSEWRVVWEVVVRGSRDQAFDVMRQNAAIGWMMLTMVEALVRSEGGIGTMLLNENKHFKLDAVFALLLVVLVTGLIIDFAIGHLKKAACPYASLKLERK